MVTNSMSKTKEFTKTETQVKAKLGQVDFGDHFFLFDSLRNTSSLFDVIEWHTTVSPIICLRCLIPFGMSWHKYQDIILP